MNILIIGNGFDLAHGLPTKYEHFLKFTKAYEKYRPICVPGRSVKTEWEVASDEDKEFLLYFANLCDQKKKLFAELGKLISQNLWLEHFYVVEIEEGWIDFESEISKIIQTLDEVRIKTTQEIRDGKRCGQLTGYQMDVLDGFLGETSAIFTLKTITDLKDKLLNDLNRLIRCLEIYLADFIGKIEILKFLPDIKALPYLDKVLSFNYTNTHKRLYAKNPRTEYDYIHGKAKLENTIVSNNMVLGIDEYLEGKEKDENIEFIEFKKFFQRIHKETGYLSRNWSDEIRADKEIYEITGYWKEGNKDVFQKEKVSSHKVFVFGHSLDITDKDVLRDFILNDNVQTTIFYTNKKDYGRKIANLVKVIGQNELIKRTGGVTKTITFKKIQACP